MALHRLASITLGVPDVGASAAFYRDFGLTEVGPGRFATAHGGEQLRLVPARRRAVIELDLAADSSDDLERIATQLGRLDVPAQRTATALDTADPGSGVKVRVAVAPRVTLPPEPPTPFNGPGRRQRGGRAPGVVAESPARPRKLGHVVYGTPHLDASQRFYLDGLGFKVSDEIAGLAYFMRCSTDHHNLLVQQAPVHFPHHTAWEVGDVDEIGRGARALLNLDPSRHTWGFGRHYVGSNFFWYFRDPAGNFAEYYSDLDVILEDEVWKPEVWEGARGLYSWGPPPPPSFLMPDDLAELMAG
jgi:catechol 2,3-dioxygenase-like lactoylglutathione lyase family enzyme